MASFELMSLMVKVGDATLPPACRKELIPLIDWLAHAKDHSTVEKLQREAYNTNITSPGDSIIITIDFKEKGVCRSVETNRALSFTNVGSTLF